jgi:hypothetical protein
MTCSGNCDPTCTLCTLFFTRTCYECGKEYIRSLGNFSSCGNCQPSPPSLESIEQTHLEAKKLLNTLMKLIPQ